VDYAARRITLVTAGGARATVLGNGTADAPRALPPGPPVLCERRGAGGGGGTRRAALTIATDLGYVNDWALYLWNKLCFCARERLDLLLFLGTFPSARADSPRCARGEAGDHWIKAVAIRYALEAAGVEEVLVMDTDAIFRRESFARPGLLDCYFAAVRSSGASAGAGAEHYQVFVNAAVLLVRRTEWSAALLRLWWGDRCGDKDQLILWHALFTLWGLAEPRLGYEDGALLDYVSRNYSAGTTMHYKQARRVVVFEYVRRAWPALLRPGAAAGVWHLRTDARLDFPDFALLPMAPFPKPPSCAAAGGDLPPFRAVPSAKHRPTTKHKSFITHTKHRPDFDCCPAGDLVAPACVAVALPPVARADGDNAPHRRLS